MGKEERNEHMSGTKYVEIKMPAKKYAKLLNEMDEAFNGYEAADIMHKTLQKYMSNGSYENYREAYYEKVKRF